MSIFNFLNETVKTDKQLQDELRALVDKVIAKQYAGVSDMKRYEDLLREIYSRNLEPSAKLIPKSK